MRAGPAFRFGFGLKQAKVPSDASIGQKDGAASALSMQFDGINRWPDGSVRWSEMRGLHPTEVFPTQVGEVEADPEAPTI